MEYTVCRSIVQTFKFVSGHAKAGARRCLVRAGGNDAADVVGEKWILALLRRADGAPDPFQGFAHDEVPG